MILKNGLLVSHRDKAQLGWVDEKIVIKESKIASMDNFLRSFMENISREMGLEFMGFKNKSRLVEMQEGTSVLITT